MNRRAGTLARAFAIASLFAVAAAAVVAWLNVRGEEPLRNGPDLLALTPELIQRGAYLARVGNCAGCHTDRGGAPFAGGKAIATPFGTVYASNITPARDTGLGSWSSSHFWRAMHHGRSKDGRLLYPAFPYTEYTQVTREDSDALYAYLRSLPPVELSNRRHDLGFPYNAQSSLAVWRALFFEAGRFEPRTDKTPEWNRGAYLVRGLGHCQACHAPRNAFGATSDTLELSGGLIPMQNWYAPSLASATDWDVQELVQFLKNGASARGAAMGPMAEVVFRSTQHFTQDDLRAVALFLKDLPPHTPASPKPAAAPPEVLTLGQRLYGDNCAQCHGTQGEGNAHYPGLAGNRTVLREHPANLLRIVISGGFPATTAGNPRPFGMPPFGHTLSDAGIAAIATYTRSAWGNAAPAVTALEVQRVR